MSETNENSRRRVVVLGASNKRDRYSYQALVRLRDAGYTVIPVHPLLSEIEGVAVVNSLAQIPGAVDTVTLYVSPRHIGSMIEGIVHLKPKRVIFNPGTESDELAAALKANNIPFIYECTLVMLSLGNF